MDEMQGAHFNYGTADTLELPPDPKGMSRPKRALVFLLVAALVVGLDQASKIVMRRLLEPGARPLIEGFMELRLVENSGAAFSFGEGFGKVFIAVAAAIALIAFIFCVAAGYVPPILVVSLAFVAGGGIGNMLDRILKETVTDFLATTFISFPVFNVADVFVVVGVLLSLIGFAIYDARRS